MNVGNIGAGNITQGAAARPPDVGLARADLAPRQAVDVAVAKFQAVHASSGSEDGPFGACGDRDG